MNLNLLFGNKLLSNLFLKSKCVLYVQTAWTNTPGTAGGPGGRDLTLAAKSGKTARNQFFFVKKLKLNFFFFFHIFLVMPKYWGKQIYTHGNFPEVGQKQKTERKREKRERKKD